MRRYSPLVQKSLPTVITLLLTAVYLSIELPFTAHLVDLLATTQDMDEIHRTEILGRLISGLAVTLVPVGLKVIPTTVNTAYWHWVGREWSLLRALGWFSGATFMLSLAYAALIMPFVYMGQALLVNVLVHVSSEEARRTSVVTLMFTQQVQQDRADIEGLPLTTEFLQEPAGKVFIGTLPLLAFLQPDIEQKLEPIAPMVARNAARSLLGSSSDVYNKMYREPLIELEGSYREYRKGVRKRQEGIEEGHRKAEEAWRDYRQEVRKRPSRWACPRIRQRLWDRGVQTPGSWNCWDKGPFVRSIHRRAEREANAAFDTAIYESFGTGLPRDLYPFAAFVATPVIQEKWRRATGAPTHLALEPGLTPEQVDKRLYRPFLTYVADQQLRRARSAADYFANGEVYENEGRRAYRAVIVPLLALVFSVSGALLHLVKASGLILKLLKPGVRRRVMRPFLVLATVVALGGPLFVPNVVSENAEIQRVWQQSRESSAGAAATTWLIQWTIHSQSVLYPINAWVREVGPGFEWVDRTALVRLIRHLEGVH